MSMNSGISKPKDVSPRAVLYINKAKTLSAVKTSKWAWEEAGSSFQKKLKVRSVLAPHVTGMEHRCREQNPPAVPVDAFI